MAFMKQPVFLTDCLVNHKNMTPRTKEQFEAIRQKSRRKILEAALQLFAEKGYLPTSMDTIARRAGVSKGLVYNYFHGKEHLLRTLLEEELTRLFDRLDPETAGREPGQLLLQIIHWNFDLLHNDTGHLKLLVSLSTQSHVHTFLRDIIARILEEKWSVAVKMFAALGEPDPKMAALFFGGILDGIGYDWLLMGEEYPLEEMRRFMIEEYKRKYNIP